MRKYILGFCIPLAFGGIQAIHSNAVVAAEPTEAVEFILPTRPGGGADRLARAVEKVIVDNKLVKQPLRFTYRPGGGGSVGWAALANHKNDMSKVSVMAPSLLTNQLLGASPLSYKDITPIAIIQNEAACFAVNPKGDINSAESLVEALKNRTDEVRFGFAVAAGNQWHIAMALLAEALGVDIQKARTTVFDSGSAARTALLGNHTDVSVSGFGTFAKFHQNGDLKCVAVAAEERLGGAAADVPTWRELGHDVVLAAKRGIIAPPGLADDEIDYWEGVFEKVVKAPEWDELMEKNYWSATYLNHEETVEFLENEQQRFKRILDKLGLLK